ncbi:MAG TPA: hypothetical protein VH210_03280 [Gaiellaceae bacterium]|nr:hypothetical protein [Gaiellaceae bacterium]
MSTADRRLLAREAMLSTAVAASLATFLLWATPPGIDWAAHAYQRTFLLQHGFQIWNNFWYAGRYSFITYSLIYYPLAALLGIKVLALASIASAAMVFSIVLYRQWGADSRVSSRTFAVLWVGIIGAAAFPFALAVSFALLAIWSLQEGRRGRFTLCAILTLGASPLAFMLLTIVMAGVALSRRSLRNVGVPIAVLAACCAGELILFRLFGDGGRFPFPALQMAAGIGFAALGLLVTRGVATARPLRGLFSIYLVAVLVVYVVPSSVGANIERIRYIALPLALIAVALRHWRPLWMVVPVIVLAAAWNTTPIVASFARANTDPEASLSYWQPAIDYLHAHLSPSYRVEAVDTAEHWSAAYLPDAGIPIVRGWYRQSDFPQNQLLYAPKLAVATYEAWLRRMAVRYVVLADAPPDYSSRAEAALIRSGRTDLKLVYWNAHLLVYELPDAKPLIVGPAPSTVMWLYPERIVATFSVPGTYRVKVRWSPYWRASSGCVSETKDGMTRLVVRHAGLVELGFRLSVGRGLQTISGIGPDQRCSP